jgi:hypothetical protein
MTIAERLANSIGSLLERRSSRRSALSRAAVAGAAIAVAPVRYLVRPGTAWAQISPGDCPGGSLCNDGYTEFCCQIQNGNNACPDGCFVGGWWKCTDYTGPYLCAAEGVRYIIDCNNLPDVPFPCECADGDCNQRRVACNIFRYGQCNTQISGTTAVVCRLVICENPSTLSGWGCNDTLMIDDNTCTHEAPCLKGLAVQLPGGVGA